MTGLNSHSLHAAYPRFVNIHIMSLNHIDKYSKEGNQNCIQHNMCYINQLSITTLYIYSQYRSM